METETKAKCRRFGMGVNIECRTENFGVIVQHCYYIYIYIYIIYIIYKHYIYLLDLTFTGTHHWPIFMYFALFPICNPLTKKKQRDV